jgi:hypothetical protein
MRLKFVRMRRFKGRRTFSVCLVLNSAKRGRFAYFAPAMDRVNASSDARTRTRGSASLGD